MQCPAEFSWQGYKHARGYPKVLAMHLSGSNFCLDTGPEMRWRHVEPFSRIDSPQSGLDQITRVNASSINKLTGDERPKRVNNVAK